MSRLGISEENIVEEGRRDDCPEYEEGSGVKIVRNRLHPNVIVDGVNRIVVVQRSEDRYLVDYSGYLAGYLSATGYGVEELGEDLLGGRARAPRWVVKSEPERLSNQAWVPDDYRYRPTVVCDRCGDETPPLDILEPGGMEDPNPDCYCTDCWEDMR